MPPSSSKVVITGALISGQRIRIEGYYSASGDWRPVAVNASGELPISVSATAEVSGQPVRVSGERSRIEGYYPASGDWRPIVVNASGQLDISVTATAEISGQAVWVSSGEVISKVSGETVAIETPTRLRTGYIKEVSSVSGGVSIAAGSVKSVVIKALPSNSGDIYVGGNLDGDMPFSGYGLVLGAGESVNLDINNLSVLRVYATVSGDKITWAGVY